MLEISQLTTCNPTSQKVVGTSLFLGGAILITGIALTVLKLQNGLIVLGTGGAFLSLSAIYGMILYAKKDSRYAPLEKDSLFSQLDSSQIEMLIFSALTETKEEKATFLADLSKKVEEKSIEEKAQESLYRLPDSSLIIKK